MILIRKPLKNNSPSIKAVTEPDGVFLVTETEGSFTAVTTGKGSLNSMEKVAALYFSTGNFTAKKNHDIDLIYFAYETVRATNCL